MGIITKRTLGYPRIYLSSPENNKNVKPDVIYAFMNTASIFSLLAKLVNSRVKIVWGIRSSNMNLTLYGQVARVLGG